MAKDTGLDLDAVIGDPERRIIVCCGSGGVGKTTTAAALAVRAAEQGRRAVSYTHLTLPTTSRRCRSRWSPYH